MRSARLLCAEQWEALAMCRVSVATFSHVLQEDVISICVLTFLQIVKETMRPETEALPIYNLICSTQGRSINSILNRNPEAQVCRETFI